MVLGFTGRSAENNDGSAGAIQIGKFLINGQLKHYAIVPPSKIRSQMDLQNLFSFWGLMAPSFILQTNSNNNTTDHFFESTDASADEVWRKINHLDKERVGTRGLWKQEKEEGDEEEDSTHNDPSTQTDGNDSGPYTDGLDRIPEGEAAGSRRQSNYDSGVDTGLQRNTTRGGKRPTNRNNGGRRSTLLEKGDTGSAPSEWGRVMENKYTKRRTTLLDRGQSTPTLLRKQIPDEEVSAAQSKKLQKWSVTMALPEDEKKLLDEYVRVKTVQSLRAIVTAADMTTGWILCTGRPTTNEKLIEAAIEESKSSPYVLVVDDLSHYNVRMSNESCLTTEESGISLLEKLMKQAVTYGQAMDGEKPKLIEFQVDDNYDLKQGVMRTSDPESSSFRMWQKAAKGTCFARLPWMKGTHFIFSEDYKAFDPGLFGRPGFVVINGRSGSQEDDSLETGFSSAEMIRSAMDSTRPCLLFDSTGKEAQYYSKLRRQIIEIDTKKQQLQVLAEMRRKIQRRGAQMEEEDDVRKSYQVFAKVGSQLKKMWQKREEKKIDKDIKKELNTLRLQPSDLEKELNSDRSTNRENSEAKPFRYYEKLKSDLKFKVWELLHENDGRRDEASIFRDKEITTARLHEMIDVYCSNPRIFQKIVVSVDPLEEAPDDVVRKMAIAFARADFEAREIGAGNADIVAVEQGWRFHQQLNRTTKRDSFWRSFLYVIYVVSVVAGVSVASLPVNDNSDRQKIITQYLAAAFSAIVAFTASILSLSGSESNLNAINLAKARVEKEIYEFRMRVGKYSLHSYEKHYEVARGADGLPNMVVNRSHSEDTIASAGPRSHNSSTVMHDVRIRFSNAIEDILQDLSYIPLQEAEHDDRFGEKRENDIAGDLQRYVHEEVLKISTKNNRFNPIVVAGVMAPESYYAARLRPLLLFLEQREGDLRLRTRFFQISALLFSSAAIVLGGIGETDYIPFVLALAAGLTQLLKIHDYERRFQITTAASRELRKLDTKWVSLSHLDQQMRPAIVGLVTTCEAVALQFATASQIQVDRSVALSIESDTSKMPRGDGAA